MTENPIALLLALYDAEKRSGASSERLATIRARMHHLIAEEASR